MKGCFLKDFGDLSCCACVVFTGKDADLRCLQKVKVHRKKKDPIALSVANNLAVMHQCVHLLPAWPVNQWMDNVNCVSHLPNKTSSMVVAGTLHWLHRLYSFVLSVQYR